MTQSIKDYIWFIKQSQHFMKGTMHPVVIFFQSLKKGLWFVKVMRENNTNI